MATDSDGKLTKFESAVTVVTADLANSLFGGLYGTSDVSSLDSYHPLAHGHVHDGEHVDGHASRVSLSDPFHVRGVLVHANLGDDAVMKNNVYDSVYQDEVIPEYEDVDGVIYYYLDLRIIRSDFTFHEIEDPSLERGLAPGLETKLIRQREDDDGLSFEDSGYDFVFGSNSLDDLAFGTSGDNRLLYDRDKAAFRAGSVDSDQWDEANRGDYSTAFGVNTTASGSSSTVSGGRGNEASSLNAVVSGGQSNEASAANTTVGGGYDNTADTIKATVGGGFENTASGEAAVVSGGDNNDATGDWSTVSGGNNNAATGDYTAIGGGGFNVIDNASSYSVIVGGGGAGAGTQNKIDNASTYSAIGGGTTNKIDNASTHSAIGGGTTNKIDNASTHSVIGGGEENTIEDASTHSAIGGGTTNKIDNASTHSVIGGGEENTIEDASGILPTEYSAIGGGRYNLIDNGSSYSVITGGGGVGTGTQNRIDNASTYSFIGGGSTNIIEDGSTHSVIGGGDTNTIDSTGTYSALLGGHNNEISGSNSVLCGGGGLAGGGNTINSDDCFIGGGSTNSINSEASVIVGGTESSIGTSASSSFIGGGYGNHIAASTFGAIVGGQDNFMTDSPWSFIGAGKNSRITNGSVSSVIMSGDTVTCSSGAEVLSDGLFTVGADWTVTNDITYDAAADNLVYAHSGPGVVSTINQDHLVLTGVADSVLYEFSFEVNWTVIPDGDHLMYISGAFADSSGAYPDNQIIFDSVNGSPLTGGTHSHYFWSDSSAVGEDFEIFFDSGAGASVGDFTLDNFTLKQVERPATEIEGSMRSAIIAGAGNTINGTGGGPCNFIGVGDCNTIMEGSYDVIVSGMSNIIQSGAGRNTILSGSHNDIGTSAKFNAIVGGTENTIGQGATSSAIFYGEKNLIGASVDQSVVLGGYGNYIMRTAPHFTKFASAFGDSSCSYIYGMSSKAASRFDIYNDPILAGYTPNGIVPCDWAVHQPDGTVGTAQTFVFTMSGHWAYGDPDAVVIPKAFVAFCDGDGGSGQRFRPREHSSYALTFDCILNFAKDIGAGFDTEAHCIAFSFKGGMMVDPSGVVKFGNEPNTLLVGYESDTGVGALTIPATTTATPGSGFEVFFSPYTTIGTAINASPSPSPVSLGDGFCMVVINNDADYRGGNIVVRVEAVETCLQLYRKACL